MKEKKQNMKKEIKNQTKKEYIDAHFDLYNLWCEGIIESYTDYRHIEKRICKLFAFKSIYEYTDNHPCYPKQRKFEVENVFSLN